MNLKISARRIIKWVAWGIVALLFLTFLIRVATFEADYYKNKEGTERYTVVDDSEPEELEEEKPTEVEVKEHIVAPDEPRYLSIEKLGISKARVLSVGVNANGEMGTPRNIFDAGWFEGSGKPGEKRTLMIDGHNGGPHVKGIFKNLPNLQDGDLVVVERGDGEIFKYKVVENKTVSLDEADDYMKLAAKSPEEGKESLTLISCTGEWSQTKKTYLSRQFVRAVLTD